MKNTPKPRTKIRRAPLDTASTKFLGIRVPLSLSEKMNEVLSQEGFGITEYVRDLLRKDLRKRGMLPASEEHSA